jgi:type IV pilus assembly protein PilY1
MRLWTSKVKANTLEWIRLWQSSSGSDYNVKGPSSTSNGGIMQEAYAFFKGKMGISGVQYTAVETGCGASYIIHIGNSFLGNTAPGDFTGNKGPKDPFFGNGTATSANKADPLPNTAEQKYLTDLGTLSAKYTITLGNSTGNMSCTKGSQNSFNFTSAVEGDGAYGVSWAKYMLAEHGIQTTSIGLLGPTCNPNYSTFLDAMGTAGGKGFIATNDMAGLSSAVSGAISNIIASNTVFASVSLPVTVNLQSQFGRTPSSTHAGGATSSNTSWPSPMPPRPTSSWWTPAGMTPSTAPRAS